MFTTSFTKTANETLSEDEKPTELVSKAWLKRRSDREDEAWGKVQQLLAKVGDKYNKSSDFKVGDLVIYNGETGWKYGEDARHTKGNWDYPDGKSADWDKDGIAIGDRGVVVKVDNNNVWINWDKHNYRDYSKTWIGSYRPYEIKKFWESMSDFARKNYEERMKLNFEKTAVSKEWMEKHILSGLNKRFAKSRGINHPKATAKAYAESVAKSPTAKKDLHNLREIFPKRKEAKDVY